MLQMLEFNHPIPSCKIHSLKYENNKWTFIYALNTPFELTNKNTENLIIYEYICDLNVKKDDLHKESINIKFKTLDEYLYYLNKQYEEDIKFREKYLKNNPDAEPSTITLENRNYTVEELLNKNVNYIANIVKKEDNLTIFAAI